MRLFIWRNQRAYMGVKQMSKHIHFPVKQAESYWGPVAKSQSVDEHPTLEELVESVEKQLQTPAKGRKRLRGASASVKQAPKKQAPKKQTPAPVRQPPVAVQQIPTPAKPVPAAAKPALTPTKQTPVAAKQTPEEKQLHSLSRRHLLMIVRDLEKELAQKKEELNAVQSAYCTGAASRRRTQSNNAAVDL